MGNGPDLPKTGKAMYTSWKWYNTRGEAEWRKLEKKTEIRWWRGWLNCWKVYKMFRALLIGVCYAMPYSKQPQNPNSLQHVFFLAHFTRWWLWVICCGFFLHCEFRSAPRSGTQSQGPLSSTCPSHEKAEKHKHTIKLKASSWQICDICQSKLQGQVQYQ